MALFKQDSARRRDIKKNKPKAQCFWKTCHKQPQFQLALTMILITAILGGWLASQGRSQLKYKLNQLIDRPIVARVKFSTIDKQETRKRRNDAKNRISPVFILNDTFFLALDKRLEAIIHIAINKKIKTIKDLKNPPLGLTDQSLRDMRTRYFDRQGKLLPLWKEHKGLYYKNVFTSLILLDPTEYKNTVKNEKLISIQNNIQALKAHKLVDYANVYQLHSLDDKKQNIQSTINNINQALNFTEIPNSLIATLNIILNDVVAKNANPTYLYDQAETKNRKKQAAAQSKIVTLIFSQNQPIVQAGQKLNAIDLERLQIENQRYQAFLKANAPYRQWYYRLGIFAFFAILATGLWGYIAAYEHRIILNPTRAFAITALILLSQAIAIFGSILVPQFTLALAVLPTLMASIIIIIAYNQRFVLVAGALLSVIIALSLNMTLETAIVLMAGVSVTAMQLNDVKTRSKLVWTGIAAGIAMAIALIATASISRPLHIPNQITDIFKDALVVLVAAIFTGLVTQGLLPAIEKVFRVSTAMTLKELNDASHPLLRRLAQEAPGTYQHSLRLADIAEEAAIAIGANGLLCKVGAMYHDIGKINKPQYFIENQAGGPNKHNNLSPAMSLLIIVGHVKNGVEMAREYNLPRPLIHFIESHHGTTLVAYFYHAQKKRQEEQGKNQPDEFDFRYPGPKPQTKEAAILMLCDTCESASRALTEPTAIRLEQLVHNMASQRLLDGQYDQCNLTLKELHTIEESVTKTLCAIYHGRIKYPSDNTKTKPQTNNANTKTQTAS